MWTILKRVTGAVSKRSWGGTDVCPFRDETKMFDYFITVNVNYICIFTTSDNSGQVMNEPIIHAGVRVDLTRIMVCRNAFYSTVLIGHRGKNEYQVWGQDGARSPLELVF